MTAATVPGAAVPGLAVPGAMTPGWPVFTPVVLQPLVFAAGGVMLAWDAEGLTAAWATGAPLTDDYAGPPQQTP